MVVAVSAVVVVVVVAATARPSVDRLSNCFLLSPSPAPATWTTAGGERRNARQRLGHSPPSFVRPAVVAAVAAVAALVRHARPGREFRPGFPRFIVNNFTFDPSGVHQVSNTTNQCFTRLLIALYLALLRGQMAPTGGLPAYILTN